MGDRQKVCKCLLCNNRSADKSGSHIVPSFIMKRINGNGRRDHEVGFAIKAGVVEPYFGREIFENKRRTITDQEDKMESRYNYDVRDFIFCKDCEKYFGSLESKYAPSLSLSFSEDINTINNKVAPSDALLFWCSVVWRISATGHLGKKLSPGLEKRLRIALATNCIVGLNVKYALFRCKDYGLVDGRGTIVCMDVKDKSVLLVADDFMLVMVFDIGDEQHEVQLMDMVLKIKPETLNDGIKQEVIAPLPIPYYDNVMRCIIQVAVRSIQIPKKFGLLNNEIFGKTLPKEILNDILSLVQSHPCKIGDRYTVEHYAWCYLEVLKRYKYIKENEDGTFSVL